MDDEIDLRAYMAVLLRHWKWIVGLVVLAVAAAWIASSLLPRTYRAESVVLVTEARYQIRFDPRFGTEEQEPAYKAFPTLATSDGILQSVVDAYSPSSEAGIDRWNLGALSGMVEATSGGDPSLVLLSVTSRSSKDAAAIANLWADTLVKQGNEIYSGGQKDVLFFEEQLAQAEKALSTAEAALIDFQARNQVNILQAQLDSANQAQADYLGNQRAISYLVQDIRGLREQLAERAEDQSAYLADAVTALLLQIKAFNTQATTSETAPITPIELQIGSAEALADMDVPQQIALLEDLMLTLEDRSAGIERLLDELGPQILSVQQQLQEYQLEQERLERAWELAQETYLTLARKLDEAHITAQEASGMLKVGSYAAVPSSPVGPRKLLNMALAGFLTFIVVVIVVFAIDFWRQDGVGAEDTNKGDAVTG